MRFSSILIASLSVFALTSATLVKVPQGHHSQLAARATPYADKVVKTLEDLTEQSRRINPLAGALKTGPEGVIAVGQFNPVIKALKKFETAIESAIASMGSSTYSAAGQTKICSAFKSLASHHEDLLTVLIVKADPVASAIEVPVHDVLRRNDHAMNALSSKVIDSVPTCAKKINADTTNLSRRLLEAVCAYTPLGEQLTEFSHTLCKVY